MCIRWFKLDVFADASGASMFHEHILLATVVLGIAILEIYLRNISLYHDIL